MGAFFTNLHVRGTSSEAVCAAIPKLTQSRAYVSPAGNGWVTVYPEVTEDQDDKKLCAIADGLSRALKTDVLAFMVHDSDIALYWLYRNGTLMDAFNSAPDYFGESVSDATRARVRGNTDVLLPLCIDDIDGTAREQLDEVLHPADGPPAFAEEIITGLAQLLGIDDVRASIGFNYFDDEGEQLLPDAGDFEPVGKGAERKTSEESSSDDVADILPDNVIPLPVDKAATSGEDKSRSPALTLPDMYPVAIGLLTQNWSDKHKETVRAYSEMFKQDAEAVLKKMLDGFDKATRDLLKKSTLPDKPAFEELKAARDQGPDALAELIAKKTPGQVTEIGIGAATHGLASFLAALLKSGLDPNAANAQGRTLRAAAEQNGKDSAVYRMIEAAVTKK